MNKIQLVNNTEEQVKIAEFVINPVIGIPGIGDMVVHNRLAYEVKRRSFISDGERLSGVVLWVSKRKAVN